MQSSLSVRTRRPRQGMPDIPMNIVEPNEETQKLYNDLRDQEIRNRQPQALENRQQSLETHLDSSTNHLRLPNYPAPHSPTDQSYISGSLSPASTLDLPDFGNTQIQDPSPPPGRRQRGRRRGPLGAEKKAVTHFKRKLGAVCKWCKDKRITCRHIDFRRFEEAYQASRRAISIDDLSTGGQASGTGLSPGPADFNGLEPTLATPLIEVEESDFPHTSQPNAHRQDLNEFVHTFDTHSLRLGQGTLQTSFGRSYNPGLGTSGPSQINSAPFPIGSEILGYTSDWKCAFSGTRASALSLHPGSCSWTGPFAQLEHHFTTEHHDYQDREYYCECVPCHSLTIGSNPPRICIEPNCFGTQWTRWLYGHARAEPTLLSTPALTRSGESESAFSFDHQGSENQFYQMPSNHSTRGGGRSHSGGGAGSGGMVYKCSDRDEGDGNRSDSGSPEKQTLEASDRLAFCQQSTENRSFTSTFVPSYPPRLSSKSELLTRFLSFTFRHSNRNSLRLLILVMLALVSIAFESGFQLESSSDYSCTFSIVPHISILLLFCGFVATWLVKWLASYCDLRFFDKRQARYLIRTIPESRQTYPLSPTETFIIESHPEMCRAQDQCDPRTDGSYSNDLTLAVSPFICLAV